MSDRWLLYACRSAYAAEVAEIVWRRGDEVLLVDNLPDGPEPSDLAPVVRPDDLTDELRRLPAAVPLITPGHRHAVVAEARTLGLERFPGLVDATAITARTASIGDGAVVNCAVVIGARTEIGAFVHVNRSASIGHDGQIAGFSTLGPACVLAGRVRVGPGAFVGAGATLAPEVTVGANAIVGAGAVVVRDVPDGAVVVGNPARVVRQGSLGYGDVAVPVDRGEW